MASSVFQPARVSPAQQISAPVSANVATKPRDRWGFLEWFVLAQVILPALLYVPGSQSFRAPLRIAPFALSLAGMVVWVYAARRIRPHVAVMPLVCIIAYLTLMIASPTTNSLLSGAAQVGLYFSVMAPVFWAPYLVRSEGQLRRVLTILLICNGINAMVGVLQVYEPERFLPREFSTIAENSMGGIAHYIGPDGHEIVRPPGLSDNPGAVCGPASTAALLGLIFAMQPIGWVKRGISLLMCFAGLAAIYLSHVRTSILIVAGMYAVYVIMLLLRRESGLALSFGFAAALLLGVALVFASVLGGESVTERFATLFEADPTSVYYQSARGYQLQYDTERYLYDYPMGAGLARWGMMRVYFGNENNDASPPLWAELQWPAWALDGGIVLLVLYNLALILTAWSEFQACRKLGHSNLGRYATMIFAANAGVLALVFGFTPFTNQVGLQYWFLAGVLHGATRLVPTPQRASI